MLYCCADTKTQAELYLTVNEPEFQKHFFQRQHKKYFYTIAWNKGPAQQVTIDEIQYTFPAGSILPLMVSQSFRFERPEQIIAWQFNREFYCIVDHDKEVSCAGFLFYGSLDILFVALDEAQLQKINLLMQVFVDEFQTTDNIQKDMLQMLLKRLIIILTRLAKERYTDKSLSSAQLDIVRSYNMLVEMHYRNEHQVKFYADQLHKSPKTLANLFALYNHKSPLTVIQERIMLEAKRLLIYTKKSAKEIAFHLGFEDAAYFSNFFKKHAGHTPQDFRRLAIFPSAGQ